MDHCVLQTQSCGINAPFNIESPEIHDSEAIKYNMELFVFCTYLQVEYYGIHVPILAGVLLEK